MTGYKLGSMDPTLAPRSLPPSIDATLDLLASADYLADRSLATVLFLALKMSRPLFLEGEAGVGKTEIAKVLSSTLGRLLAVYLIETRLTGVTARTALDQTGTPGDVL